MRSQKSPRVKSVSFILKQAASVVLSQLHISVFFATIINNNNNN